MSASENLVQSADYAFAFRRLDPEPEAPHSLLVLLHGVGGDETQLEHVGRRAPEGMLVVLPRGHRSISGGKWGWYRVGFSEDGPQVVEDELHEARGRLGEFLEQLQRHHGIAPDRTWVGGFSQGGILAATVAMTSPESLRGFAMVSGRLLPEAEDAAAPERLARLSALLVHGRRDDVLAVEEAQRAAARLQRLGVTHALRLHDASHELTRAMEDDVVAWLGASAGSAAAADGTS